MTGFFSVLRSEASIHFEGPALLPLTDQGIIANGLGLMFSPKCASIKEIIDLANGKLNDSICYCLETEKWEHPDCTRVKSIDVKKAHNWD